MAPETIGFIAVVATGAVVLWCYVACLFVSFVSKDLDRRWKLLALIPVVAPYAAWRAGARVLPILWGVSVFAYLALRVVYS